MNSVNSSPVELYAFHWDLQYNCVHRKVSYNGNYKNYMK